MAGVLKIWIAYNFKVDLSKFVIRLIGVERPIYFLSINFCFTIFFFNNKLENKVFHVMPLTRDIHILLNFFMSLALINPPSGPLAYPI